MLTRRMKILLHREALLVAFSAARRAADRIEALWAMGLCRWRPQHRPCSLSVVDLGLSRGWRLPQVLSLAVRADAYRGLDQQEAAGFGCRRVQEVERRRVFGDE